MVSVIIPYNVDRGYLNEAISSVEAQTYHEWEIIESQSDNLCSYNLNSGIEAANGEFVKILAEDDLLPLDSLEILVSHIANCDFIYGDGENFGDLRGWPERYYDHTTYLQEMLQGNCINGGGTLYRRDVLLEVGGYDDSLWTAEEYDLHLKLLKNGYKHKHIPKVVYKYRRHSGNKSGQDREKRHELIKKIRQRYV